MIASKQATDILRTTIGHDGFKVKSSTRGWNYKAEQECEWLIVDLCGELANAVVLLGNGEVLLQFADDISQARCQFANKVVQEALTEARNANERMKAFAIESLSPETPRYIRRVFIFVTDAGIDWGTSREEFGPIEPFMSVRV